MTRRTIRPFHRRQLLQLALLGLALGAGIAQAAAPDAILGNWLTDDGASKVEVTAAKAADGSPLYNGRIVWLKEPLRDGQPQLDSNNGDAGARSRPIMGLMVLSGFKIADAGYGGGTVYSPRAGKAYPADLVVGADGRLELKVKAGLLTKTEHWTR